MEEGDVQYVHLHRRAYFLKRCIGTRCSVLIEHVRGVVRRAHNEVDRADVEVDPLSEFCGPRPMPSQFGSISVRDWLPSAGPSSPAHSCPTVTFGFKCVRGGTLSVFVSLSDLCTFMRAVSEWSGEHVDTAQSTDSSD